MHLRLTDKLRALRQGTASPETFILADAKDADMAWGVASAGRPWPADHDGYRSIHALHDDIRQIVQQGIVDIMLTSVSTMSRLAGEEDLFAGTAVTPAVRLNDTTDIWAPRGGTYRQEASHPFATCALAEARYGSARHPVGRTPLVALGLYSITFVNQLQADLRSLQAFRQFRLAAAECGLRYFLEVFAPNVECGLSAEETARFVNDSVARTLAGIPLDGRPEFLKIPYFGPAALEELVAYDPSVVVGILGGASGTTYDGFKLIAEAQKYGARVALFGRRIKDAEAPLEFVRLLRAIVQHQLTAEQAVDVYHDRLRELGIPPKRPLDQDRQGTAPELAYLRP